MPSYILSLTYSIFKETELTPIDSESIIIPLIYIDVFVLSLGG